VTEVIETADLIKSCVIDLNTDAETVANSLSDANKDIVNQKSDAITSTEGQIKELQAQHLKLTQERYDIEREAVTKSLSGLLGEEGNKMLENIKHLKKETRLSLY